MNIDAMGPYMEFARPYYTEKDPAHNFEHIQRIFRRLPAMSEGLEPVCPHRLYFIAAFHGLRRNVLNAPGFRILAGVFLTRLGWDEPEIDEVFESLRRHHDDPKTVEEKIVHDANYVEMLGAMGIAKAFTTGGARGQSYRQTADIFEYRFFDKVEFRTPLGRRLAKENRAFTKSVLAKLREELAVAEGSVSDGDS